jgi:putative transcriptional regulator
MTKKSSRLTKAILSTAKDMHEGGVLNKEEYSKITLRHIEEAPTALTEPITPQDIRALREEAHVSQAVFARYLNLTTGYISQLERGLKHPAGATLALLNLIRHKGLNIVRI